MNEIINIKSHSFKNEALQQATEEINQYGTEMLKNVRNIARVLADVSKNECYKEDGFKNCAEYAMETFGFKKSFAYNLISIGKRFSEANSELAGYSATQLIEMLPMTDKELSEKMESGEINPDMTAKEIREAVKEAKPTKTRNRKVKTFKFKRVGENDIIIAPEEEFKERAFADLCKEVQKIKLDERTIYVGIEYMADYEYPVMWEQLEEVKTVEDQTEEKENN